MLVRESAVRAGAGHLPILEEGGLVGIITRTDYLALRRAEKEKVAALTGSLL